MRNANAKQQTVFLTAINAVVRALGLTMRVILSRLVGAEIMGIAELCSGVHMLLITPLTSGLPLAVSRMTAKAPEEKKLMPLWAGIAMVRKASLLLIPLLLVCSPLLAKLMQDQRVLPSLWFSAPCILILGYSAVYNGYCYGVEKSWIPALSELLEQVLRFALSIGLVYCFTKLTTAWLAAVPVFATMLAEIGGLVLVLWLLRLPAIEPDRARSWQRPVFRLAAPSTVTRLINTALRSATAILIPLRLQVSGLSGAESTARLGMVNGMVMPIIMLPCIFTAALSMVILPKFARLEGDRPALRRLLWMCLSWAVPIGVLCAGLIYLAAPFLATTVYRMAELCELFRVSAPLAVLHTLTHLMGGSIAGLGQQKRSMYGTLVASVVSLGLTFVLTAMPSLRLLGAVYAMYAAQAIMLVWDIWILVLAMRGKPVRHRSYDREVNL